MEFANESDTATGTVNLGLGSYYYSSASSTLDGAIAEFRIYGDNLTPTEVEGIFAESAGRFYPTVSGTVYTDEGSTNIGANKTVRIAINGTDFGITAETDASGAYSISGLIAVRRRCADRLPGGRNGRRGGRDGLGRRRPFRPGPLPGPAHRPPRQRRQPDQRQPGHGGRGGEDDISNIYSASGSDLTVVDGNELFVWTGDTFAPGGNLTVDDIDINGTLTLGANDVEVHGSWDATGGSFTTAAGSQVMFTSTAAETITTSGSSFHDVIINDGLVGHWKLDETSAGTFRRLVGSRP